MLKEILREWDRKKDRVSANRAEYFFTNDLADVRHTDEVDRRLDAVQLMAVVVAERNFAVHHALDGNILRYMLPLCHEPDGVVVDQEQKSQSVFLVDFQHSRSKLVHRMWNSYWLAMATEYRTVVDCC